MRWTEIVERAAATGETLPTYRLMDLWTSRGLLKAQLLRGQGGKYRDWSEADVDVALTVARLREAGLTDDLAFKAARALADRKGDRVYIDRDGVPDLTIIVHATVQR